MGMAFSRIYVDVPPETRDKLKAKAQESGKSMKVFLADLIDKECSKPKRRSRK